MLCGSKLTDEKLTDAVTNCHITNLTPISNLTPFFGSMYIGNIHWKYCRLETWIGYWKQKLDIGNIKRRLET